MDQRDIIVAKKKELIRSIFYKLIDSLVRGFLTAKAPWLVTGFTGRVFNILWGKLLGAISEFAAANGYAIGVKAETANKIEGMNEALAELRVLEEKHVPGTPLTPEEKEANDKADEKIDDGLSWD